MENKEKLIGLSFWIYRGPVLNYYTGQLETGSIVNGSSVDRLRKNNKKKPKDGGSIAELDLWHIDCSLCGLEEARGVKWPGR